MKILSNNTYKGIRYFIKDITGQKFGRLTAIKFVERKHKGETRWLFLCNCGKKIIKSSSSVNYGDIQSCGCLAKEHS